ncbi:MAG: hypothetical protein IT558_00090 [Alphaproteobacteria bacterium]|nr:hypothetical protein [Alphaproteobacteria bacterium]
MVKILTAVFVSAAIIVIGGLAYVAVTDAPVLKKEIVKEIPHERFPD